MTVKKYLLFFIFYWCLCLKTTAQTQDFGFVSPTPNTLKWKQLNNDTLRIIYPPDQEAYARQLAGNMLWQARNTSFSLGNHVQKINVVLHTENAQSNGYVGLAPFRSEFYLTPLHQTNQLGSIDFGKLLSIHEYRHVLQTANSLKGFSKFLYFISGERGWTAYHYLSTPAWFFEGDAVLTETAFTKQGRGRIPTFLNDYRFLALGNSMYSYQKARNGSLKDFVPDHYRLGYMLCRNGLDEYGKDFWTQVYDHTNRGNPLLFSFKRNFKKQSGVSLTSFYNQTINKYYGNWLKDTLISQNNYARQINQEAKVFTTYSYPQFVDNHQLIVLKKSFDKNPEFIFIDLEGNEESIVKSGISSDTYFHYANQKIVYTEVRYHLRYQNKNYNEIILVDANTKIKKQITNQTKTFAPSLNADASKIIAMEFKENQTSALVVYNLQGKKLTEISVNNYYYTFPKFINDNEAVSAVRDSSGNMSIALIDLITTKHTLLFSPTNNIISDLSYANQQLFFTASFNGKDQLFVFDLTENKLYRTLQRVNYAYMPTVNSADDIIAFTELNPKGRQLMVSELNKFNREEIRVLELHKLQGFQSKNFNSINQEIKSLQSPFIVKDYKRNRFLFNPHSWQPTVSRSKLGLKLFSDDILSTTHIEAGAYYSTIEKKPFYQLGITYGGWYPMFKLTGEYIPLRYITKPFKGQFADSLSVSEKTISLFSYLPFNLTKGLFIQKINVGAGLNYVNVLGIKEKQLTQELALIHLSGNYLKALRSAYQHPFSRKAIYFQIDYYKQPNGKSEQLATFTECSLPGISNNSAFLFNIGLLKQQVKSGYTLLSDFNLTRGYTSIGLDKFIRTQFNYHFTIAYPDKGINGLIYFYRIRLNPFIDLGWAQAYTSNRFYPANTAGLEIIADVNLFNALPSKLGLRFNYRLTNYYNKQTIYTPVQIFIPVYFF